MARQAGTSTQSSFVRGLITENTAITFPEDACTETFNCVFDQSGRVTRRLGYDFEPDYELYNATIVNDEEVFTEFVWGSVNGDGSTTFFVQQQGSDLHFYDVSDGTGVSANKLPTIIDLNDHLVADSSKEPANFVCQYAVGNGHLIVVNPACTPFFCANNETSGEIEATTITLKYRDFAGLDDGMEIWFRPTKSVVTIVSDEPEHYYNLVNQGWHLTDALTQWDTARTDMPSNADYPAQYRASETDSFDNARVTSHTILSNTPAPKGHFLLEVGNGDREQALDDEGLDTASFTSSVQVGGGSGTILFSFPPGATGASWGNVASAFDGSTSTASNGITGTGNNQMWIGKSWTSPKRAAGVVVKGSATQGFIDGINEQITIALYAKTGASPPSTGVDGIFLGSTTFTDTSNESAGRTINSSDTTNFYDHFWIEFQTNNNNRSTLWSEIEFFERITDSSSAGLAGEITPERPQTVAFFNGRIFYAGIETPVFNGNIYFTQVVESTAQYGKCYQRNDPTDEFFSDLLADDGGVIRIPEIGNVRKLFPYQSSLLVFATNGVWMISGSKGAPFAANDYVVRKLSSLGMDSPLSVIDVQGVPVWWGEEGIYSIKFDANYDSFQVISVTENTIGTFIQDIPIFNRKFVKGSYDVLNYFGYWLYNDTEDLEAEDAYKYNKILTYNAPAQSFSPWTIEDATPQIRGAAYVGSALATEDDAVYFTTTVPVDATHESLTYSQAWSNLYKDWNTYATDVSGLSADEIDYLSYFISGYGIHADGTRFFQPQYVFFFLEQEENASAYMQAIFDFTTSGNTGKWSSKQQIYNNCLMDRGVNYRRLKVRGKGRAMQFRVNSETGKPFTLIGWASKESANAGV